MGSFPETIGLPLLPLIRARLTVQCTVQFTVQCKKNVHHYLQCTVQCIVNWIVVLSKNMLKSGGRFSHRIS